MSRYSSFHHSDASRDLAKCISFHIIFVCLVTQYACIWDSKTVDTIMHFLLGTLLKYYNWENVKVQNILRV